MEQRLTFLGMTGERSSDGHLLARYRCACGAETIVRRSRVRNGYTRSCGCLAEEARRTSGVKHGRRHTPEYRSWQAMMTRCRNPNSKDFPRWGGVGVTVCQQWESFEQFFADMGERPAGTTLDRIDANKGYEPGNCRWATPREQARNRRDVTVVATTTGEMKLPDYADQLGITRGAAHQRLKRGTLEGVKNV